MQGLANTNLAIEQNRQMYQRLSKNNILNSKPKPSYSSNDVIYYNDPKKLNKKKLKRNLLIGFATLAGATIATLTLMSGRGKRVNYKKIIDVAKDAAQDIKDSKIAEETQTFLGKASNAMSNFTNIKDDYYSKFEDFAASKKGFGWIKKAGSACSDFYRNCFKKAMKKRYDKLLEIIPDTKAGKEFKGKLPDFEDWFDKLNNEMHDTLHTKGGRVTDKLLNKDVFSKVTSANIADGKILASNKIMESLTDAKIPENANEELKMAIQKFNESNSALTNEIVGKLRDINCGSAPTDVISILTSLGLLGGAVALEDEKDKKKSIITNLGIPLIASIATTMYGVLSGKSGAKMLVLGLLSGQVASNGAKVIDKLANKKTHE